MNNLVCPSPFKFLRLPLLGLIVCGLLFSGCAGAPPSKTVQIQKECSSAIELASLSETLTRALDNFQETKPSNEWTLSREKLIYEVKSNYYKILAKKEQLDISEEVRGHFEKALAQAEERYETGEGDVTQSAITKLKLGLAGTVNDISQNKGEIQLALLNLGLYLRCTVNPEGKLPEAGLKAVDFPHNTIEEFIKSRNSLSGDGVLSIKSFSRNKQYELKKAQIEVNQARERMRLAKKNRKMTRALLVTEVANYDFGIGEAGDLFEALIIYTRVLVGYHQTVLEFNLSVIELEKVFVMN